MQKEAKSEDIETDSSESNASLNISNSSEELAPEFYFDRELEDQETMFFLQWKI